MEFQTGPLLEKIEYPSDLRKLPVEKLSEVCQELRQFIIDTVSKKGGHFGASLGVIELTTALHYVFDTPDDLLVWDVGHQAYAHKILTGRRKIFHTNRLSKGLSGFPKRAESPYDTFGVGHSSTSISAALGMSMALKQEGSERHVIAVIGDGALTGGMAFEGLNHAGSSNANLLVIINDNCMSIDPNVGALKEYLATVTASPTFNVVRDRLRDSLEKVSTYGPDLRELASKIELAIKGVVSRQSNLFESLNFRYFGPVDGHDVVHLEKILRDLKNIPGPKILHCLTRKGKGYKFSENGDQTIWHAPGLFNSETGERIKGSSDTPEPPKYQDVFGKTLLELAQENSKIIGVTPAMLSGSSMKIMQEALPSRVFDVGIAEQHAVTFSAGLATQGMVPFCNIYSTFMQRAYDQVIHDVAIQNLKVIFCLDRAGLVGPDGATHQGAYDMAYLRSIPNIIVSAPMNEEELRNLMYTAQGESITGPMAIRYPRGQGVMLEWQKPFSLIPIGTGRKLRDGKELAFLSIGHVGNIVSDVCQKLEKEGTSVGHYDLRFVKPLDEKLLHEVCTQYKKIITVEDGCIAGGMGSAVLEWMADHGYQAEVRRLGVPDRIIEHGEPKEQYAECGYDEAGILEAARKMLSDTSP